MIEPEKIAENLYISKCIKRTKHCIVPLATGVPIIVLGLNLFIWSGKWIELYSDPYPIELIWSLVVPITAFILISTEVYGEQIKTHKYYYYGALVIYEVIGLLSISTYFYSLAKLWSDRLNGKSIQNMVLEPIILQYVLEPLYVITALHFICLYWIKNTFAHISLCEWKMFAIEPRRPPFSTIPIRDGAIPVTLGVIHFIVSCIYSENSGMTFTFLTLHVCNIAVCKNSIHFGNVLGYWDSYCTDIYFMNINMLLLELLILKYDDTFNYPNCILFWICNISMGRQWILDMEIDTERYKNYYKRKLDTNTISTL